MNKQEFHHEIHKKHIKNSSILNLIDENNKKYSGHKECATLLENGVHQLLSGSPGLDKTAQSILLQEVEKVFTEADNQLLLSLPTKDEIYKNICESNLHAAPGTDGLTTFLYKECWNVLGDAVTELATRIHQGEKPSVSQRTSMMIFCTKPKKIHSSDHKISDKRKLSLLNANFKVVSGIEAKRFKKLVTHTLSSSQLAAGDRRRLTMASIRSEIQSSLST